jgi:hypothetical protein
MSNTSTSANHALSPDSAAFNDVFMTEDGDGPPPSNNTQPTDFSNVLVDQEIPPSQKHQTEAGKDGGGVGEVGAWWIKDTFMPFFQKGTTKRGRPRKPAGGAGGSAANSNNNNKEGVDPAAVDLVEDEGEPSAKKKKEVLLVAVSDDVLKPTDCIFQFRTGMHLSQCSDCKKLQDDHMYAVAFDGGYAMLVHQCRRDLSANICISKTFAANFGESSDNNKENVPPPPLISFANTTQEEYDKLCKW